MLGVWGVFGGGGGGGGGVDALFGVRLGARGVLGGSAFEALLMHRLERAVGVRTGAMIEYLYGGLGIVLVGTCDNGCDGECSE